MDTRKSHFHINSKLPHYDIAYGGVTPNVISDSTNVELKEALMDFMEESGVSKINILPNFSLGNILGPSGYVAELNLNRVFSTSLFHQPLFRFISFFEITFDNEMLLKIKTDEWKDVIRKTIPLHTPYYPKLSDTCTSAWAPALGQYGSNIGIYSFEENVGNERTKRFFIGVHSGLHMETYDLLIHHLTVDILYKNSDIINQYASALDDNVTKPKTYKDVFNDTSGIMKNMREVARENNRRLAVQFAKTLNIHFKDKEVIPSLSELSIPPSNDTFPYALDGLKWWNPPENITSVPLFLDSVIHGDIYEDDVDAVVEARIKPKHELKSMPIGVIYRKLKAHATTPQQQEALKEYNRISFIEKRGTVIPTLESEYNSYRIRGEFLLFYNHCSPTLTDNKYPYTCVIKQQSIFQGYEILNSCLSKNNEEEHRAHSNQWTNSFGNGYPTIPNIEKRKESIVKIENSQAGIFFSAYNNISINRKDMPKQVKYVPNYEYWSDGLVKRDLHNSGFSPNSIELVPEFVYLSPDIHTKTLDMLT